MQNETADSVLQLLDAYCDWHPVECNRFALLRTQLAGGAGDPFSRSNMTGHITSSAAVLNRTGTKMLLIDHAFLKRWLTPGGHYETPGTLLDSALREVAEETGLADAVPHEWTFGSGIPFDIDTHDIPANPKKLEGAHVHHDFLFLAVAEERDGLQAQLAEVHAAVWEPVSKLRDSVDVRVQRVLAKMAAAGVIG